MACSLSSTWLATTAPSMPFDAISGGAWKGATIRACEWAACQTMAATSAAATRPMATVRVCSISFSRLDQLSRNLPLCSRTNWAAM